MNTGTISGNTALLGIIGDPVAQVRAPMVWSALFARNEIDAVCVPFHIAPSDVSAFIAGATSIKNMLGLVVTVPHKFAAFAASDHCSARAKKIGAANLLRWNEAGELTCDHVDGIGFVQSLRSRGFDPQGKRVMLVGCGGVGVAIALALAEAGVEHLQLHDPNRAQSEALLEKLQHEPVVAAIGDPCPTDQHLIINASPVGMHSNNGNPIDCRGLEAQMWVADVIMHPAMTPLLQQAQQLGCVVHLGTYMMEAQLPLIADFFGLPRADWAYSIT